MQRVEAQIAVSVSDLKKSPTAIMAKADGEAVAVLNHNRVMAYMVPADAYEAMVEQLDDLALAKIARARANEVPVRVSLDDLGSSVSALCTEGMAETWQHHSRAVQEEAD